MGDQVTIQGDVTLCLNGCTLKALPYTSGAVKVSAGASLTICDCGNGGEITSACSNTNPTLRVYGTCTLESGAITVEDATASGGCAVRINDTGVFTMTGGSLVGGKYGVYNQNVANLNGGTVSGVTAGAANESNPGRLNVAGSAIKSSAGAAISLDYGSLDMTGGSASGAAADVELATSERNNHENIVLRIAGGSADRIVHRSDYPLYLSGAPTVTSVELASVENQLFASENGQAYNGSVITVSLQDPPEAGETVIQGISGNADKFTYAGEDFELAKDGNGNLILQTPTTAPEYANHGVDGTDTDPQTWQAWNPTETPTISQSGYYYLDDDFELINQKITINADVHLCLNGHVMSDNGKNARFIIVNRDASLTICDCSKDKTGRINYNCNTDTGYAINNKGALTLYSGKIYSDGGNGILIMSNGGSDVKFDMEGGTIDVGRIGILFSIGKEVNIKDGTLIYGGQTGVLFGAEGTLTVSGGTIQPRENGASDSQGISRTSAGDLYVTDGNISGKQNGIRIINAGDGEVEISGGNISASGEKGYGIYLYETATANLYLSNDPTISGQKADLYIGKPNKVYAGKDTAAYNGSALDIYYAGDAATEDPIILNVTADKANLFNLNYPADKTLEHRADNHLYLADKILPMPTLTVTVEPSSLTYGQTAQATVSGEPSGASISYEIIESEPAGVASIGTDGAITTNGVGTFKVKVTVSATGYSDGEATSAEITVNKATPTPEAPTGLTATYGDTLANIALPTGWTWKTPETSVGNVGTHKFEAVYQETPEEYYIPVTKMLSVVVNAKTITDAVVVLGAYPTYDGTQKTQTITSVTVDGTVLTAGSDYTVTGNTGTEAKEYTLTITGTGNYSGTKEVTWYIQKAIPGVTAPTIRTLTYTGTAQALLNPGNTEQGTMVYSLQETEGYSVDIPKKIDAGTYDVWYKVLGYDGYQNTNPVKLQVTIKKAPLTVTADDIWVYAGNTPKFTATIKGYVNGEDGRVLKGELTFTCGYSQKYSKPGSRYTITPKGLTADNYDITFKTGTLTVKDPLSPRFNVYVLDSKHGTVEADCRYARKGDVVTLTIKPDWGYELETLTVTDSHGYELKLTYHSNGTYTFTMPRDNVTVKAIFTVRDMPFVDVPGDAWYAGGVRYVYAHGLMNGTGNWRFSPNRTTTRAMIATILYRMEGSPRVYGTSQFGDVEAGSWYEDAVIWATQNDIVEGYTSKTFGPNDPITREQMAAMLYRYADYCRCDMSAGRYVDLSKFSDMNEISDYAIPALRWAVGEEIIEGRTGKRLAPTDTATRAEVAVMLMRFCEDVIW